MEEIKKTNWARFFKNTTLYLVGLAIYTLAVVYLMRPTPKEDIAVKPQYWEKPNFKPDTVWMPGNKYTEYVPYPIEIPPKEVLVYNPPETVYADNTYLPHRPAEPILRRNGKVLLGGDFSKDSLTLTLQDTSGRIETKNYLVDYNGYKYRYAGDNMGVTFIKRDIPKASSKPFITYDKTWINYSRDLLQKSDRLGVESSVTIKDKIKLGVYGEKYFNNHPISEQVGFKVGVSLF